MAKLRCMTGGRGSPSHSVLSGTTHETAGHVLQLSQLRGGRLLGLGARGTQRLEWERATSVTRSTPAAGEDASGRTARLRLDLVVANLRNESKDGGLS